MRKYIKDLKNDCKLGIWSDDSIQAIEKLEQDLERLEHLENENKKLKEKLYHLENAYGQVCLDEKYIRKENEKLEKENQELKTIVKLLKTVLDVYAGDGKGYVDCCFENPIMIFDLYNQDELCLYSKLKEVLNNAK